MSDGNLPARFNARSRMERPEDEFRAGTWWQLRHPGEPADDASENTKSAYKAAIRVHETLADRPWSKSAVPPADGLVLLMTEVMVIDGEVHSFRFAPHPSWEDQSPVKILLQDFLLCMVEEPNGAALRAAEERRLMEHIGLLTMDMARPPTPEEIKAIVDRKLTPSPAKTAGAQQIEGPGAGTGQEEDFDRMSALVPAELLPSRDLAAAEAVVRVKIAESEAIAEIMSGKVASMNKSMGIVSRFQQEKVSTAMAENQSRLSFAQKMLSSVHTMKLWLGEGVDLHALVDGRGAPAEEPVHFMQQMLYLDEEIFTSKLDENGFSSDNLHQLDRLLQENPAIVQRMMPYDRCVCIAKTRRYEREFAVPGNWSEVFSIIGKIDADRRIFMFIRDGERVTMVVADEETSRARRLFPSRSEIDGIFRSNEWGDAGKVIDVTDVRYADKRQDHDNVALFYKRFLLILWGSHHRESTLGSFPKGRNWLLQSAHDEHFRFVHDEEMGLESPKPRVDDYIKAMNAGIRHGSLCLVRWREFLADEKAAPGAWNNPIHRSSEQIRAARDVRDIDFVTRKGNALTMTCVTTRMHEYRDNPKVSNIQVKVVSDVLNKKIDARNLLCLDHMTSQELEFYIGSRRDRVGYQDWLRNFMTALPSVRRRERLEEALENRIRHGGHDLEGVNDALLKAAIHEAVLAADWMLPEPSRDQLIVGQARRLGLGAPPGDASRISMRPNGDFLRYYPAEPLFDGIIEEPFEKQITSRLLRNGTWSDKGVRIVTAGEPDAAGEMRIATGEQLVPREWGVMQNLQDREWIADLISGRSGEVIETLDEVLNPSLHTATRWADEILSINYKSKSKKVLEPLLRFPVGMCVLPPLGRNGKYYTPSENIQPRLRMVYVSVNRMLHAHLAGHEEAVNHYLKIFQDPARGFAILDGDRQRGRDSVGISMATPFEGELFRTILDENVEFDRTGGVNFDPIDRSSVRSLNSNVDFDVMTFTSPTIETALARSAFRESLHMLNHQTPETRETWLDEQKHVRTFMAPGVAERLVKVIGINHAIPADCENEYGQPET